MAATIDLTLIAQRTKAGWVTVDPPEKKVAHLIWASPHYFAMCVWRLYGRTLAEKDCAAHVQSGTPPARAEDDR